MPQPPYMLTRATPPVVVEVSRTLRLNLFYLGFNTRKGYSYDITDLKKNKTII